MQLFGEAADDREQLSLGRSGPLPTIPVCEMTVRAGIHVHVFCIPNGRNSVPLQEQDLRNLFFYLPLLIQLYTPQSLHFIHQDVFSSFSWPYVSCPVSFLSQPLSQQT